jgi:hypothetical protein
MTNLVAELRAEVLVPYKDGYEPIRARPSDLMLRAAAEIERLSHFERMHAEATEVRGDADVLAYITSGNAVPVTRCTVSADLIRQLLARGSRAELIPPKQTGRDPGIPFHATLTGAEDEDGVEVTHVLCRFRDGQKWAAATVDAECDELAGLIMRAIEQHNAPSGECICPKCGLRHGSSSADGGF